MNSVGLIDRSRAALVVIDIQERLMPVISNPETVFSNTNILLQGAQALGVPILVTEQYPKGLGHTCAEVVLPDGQQIIEKVCFSCVQSQDFLTELKSRNIHHLILCGVEAHICVLKTALEARQKGFDVHVVADAISSRNANNHQMAISRMIQSNIWVVTTEMILFAMLDLAGTDEFKTISKLIK